MSLCCDMKAPFTNSNFSLRKCACYLLQRQTSNTDHVLTRKTSTKLNKGPVNNMYNSINSKLSSAFSNDDKTNTQI